MSKPSEKPIRTLRNVSTSGLGVTQDDVKNLDPATVFNDRPEEGFNFDKEIEKESYTQKGGRRRKSKRRKSKKSKRRRRMSRRR